MTRLRLLKQRANRANIGVHRLEGGYVAAHGHGDGACSDIMTKREATLLASRWALPWKRIKCEMLVSQPDTATLDE